MSALSWQWVRKAGAERGLARPHAQPLGVTAAVAAEQNLVAPLLPHPQALFSLRFINAPAGATSTKAIARVNPTLAQNSQKNWQKASNRGITDLSRTS
jgi:hypothetical protein